MNSGVWAALQYECVCVCMLSWVCVRSYLHNGAFEQRAQFMLNERIQKE